MDPKEPELPASHFAEYEPEPVKALPYTGPKRMKVLVPGKPNNRAYRRAEASFNKKALELAKKTAKRALNTANDVLGKMAEAQRALEPLLQTSPETATPAAPPEQESQS
jgi:hypothetical protein